MVGNFVSRIVTLLALAGLVPFLAGLLFTFAPSMSPLAPQQLETAIIGYGVLILAFLGGVRWGLRMQGGSGSDLTFIMGILGAMGGLIMLLLPYTFALALLAVGFALQGAWDVWSNGVPAFYARLRGVMTWLVCFVVVAILLARVFVGS